ncbi:MAG: DUF4384 domain-containing protein [Hormoscilla sp.]
MSHQKYENVETDFLEAMATRYGFTGKKRSVFLQRFSENNADLDDKSLAEVYAPDLLGVKHDDLDEDACKHATTQVRDNLKEICKKLEKEGCKFNDATKGKWKIAKRWLREDVFPKWVQGPLTLEQLWQQLVDRARPTNLMGPVIADNLDMWSPYQKCVRLGSNIRFEFKLGHAGHLLLLEKATSGKVLCLCPSFLAPHPDLPDGETVLPQEGAPIKSFKITGTIGLEQLVAVMGEKLPPLNWIPQPDQQPSQLQKDHLHQLLQYLEGRSDYQVLYAEYTVTAV